MSNDVFDWPFTPMRPFAAEGARVALVSCTDCGAALVIDPATPFDVLERHMAWHAATDYSEERF